MADRFRMVRPNDPLEIPAPQANAWTEAARRVLTSPQTPTAVMLGGKLFPTAILVEVENASGTGSANNIDQFGVMGINGPMFTPTENGDFFKSGVALTGVKPTAVDHAGKFVVAAEPIGAGSVGRAFIAGVFPCKINVISASDQFADITDGSTAYLESNAYGAAQILWKESGTGEKFAIVRMVGGRRWVRFRINGNRTRGGVYQAHVWKAPATTTFNPTVSGAITVAQMGVQGAEVHFINLIEIAANTHDLTAGTLVWGTPSLLTSSATGDTKPVYEGFTISGEDCT